MRDESDKPGNAPLPMPPEQWTIARTRRRLPNRRENESRTIEVNGVEYVACISKFPGTNELAEVFLNVSKSGSELERNARDASVMLSIGLQHSVAAEVFRKALSRTATGAPDSALASLLDQLANEAAP